MKALVISIEGRRAIVLLSVGEMRTVRTERGWCVGQEVWIEDSLTIPATFGRNALVPIMACALLLIMITAGLGKLGGAYTDQKHPPQPLASGSIPIGSTEPTATPMAIWTIESTVSPEITSTLAPTESFKPTPTLTVAQATATPEPLQMEKVPFIKYDDNDDDDDDDDDDDEDDDDDDDEDND